jgi:hypothetical protein
VESVAAFRSVRVAPFALAAACCAGCAPQPHRDDAALVGSVLTALAAGNVHSVAAAFAPSSAGQLDDKVRSGMLQKRIERFGALQKVELRPPSTPGDRETFVATFERGEQDIDVTFDADGKLIGYWIHPHGGY